MFIMLQKNFLLIKESWKYVSQFQQTNKQTNIKQLNCF